MFFAVLISSLALAIGVAIYDMVVRELQISSITEQSQYALYAADTGVECALYWDSHYFNGTVYGSIFPTSSSDTSAPGAINTLCAGLDVAARRTQPIWTDSQSGITTTTLQIGTYYAIINVIKTKNNSTGNTDTTIYSHGYNSVNTTLPSTVERELQINY
jgi:hypothetical protein